MRAEGAPEIFLGYTKAETLKTLLFWEFGFGKNKKPFRFLRFFVKNNPPTDPQNLGTFRTSRAAERKGFR